MTVPARLTRRGASSMVRSSTWYPAGSGMGFEVVVLHAGGAMVELSAGPSSAAVVGRCYTGARARARPGASQHPPGYDPGGCAINRTHLCIWVTVGEGLRIEGAAFSDSVTKEESAPMS